MTRLPKEPDEVAAQYVRAVRQLADGLLKGRVVDRSRVILDVTAPARWCLWQVSPTQLIAKRQPGMRASDLEAHLFLMARDLVAIVTSRLTLSERLWCLRTLERRDTIHDGAHVPHMRIAVDFVGLAAWGLSISLVIQPDKNARLCALGGTLEAATEAEAA
jgi:hypothetical protein